jgi:SAM-dependent methyltransferase
MPSSTKHLYDQIGAGYRSRRQSDPRLACLIWDALGDAKSVVNVGAGTGSYEPSDRLVVAVEPSMAMVRQRPMDAAPVVRACAEAMPFKDATFAAALAVLTIHHWSDWRQGLRELRRVSRNRIVLLTWDPQSEAFWLIRDYFPHLLEADRHRFPSMSELSECLGKIETVTVPIPHDCTDGFLGAYWRRPTAYLDPDVRSAISSLAFAASANALARLAHDLTTGTWQSKYGQLLVRNEVDLGYRLVIARPHSPQE